MKKTLLFIFLQSAVIFCNRTQAQPVPPSTSPYTRTLLPLTTQGAWQSALGVSGGGSGIPTLNGIGTNTSLISPSFSSATFANTINFGPAAPMFIYMANPGGIAGDTPVFVVCAPNSSGSFFGATMTMSNAFNGFPADARGYFHWDDQALSVGAVGWNCTNTDLPGVDLIVANGEPIVVGSSASGINQANLWMTHNVAQGYKFIIPFVPNALGSPTQGRPIDTTYGVFTNFPADGLGTLLWIDQISGQVTWQKNSINFFSNCPVIADLSTGSYPPLQGSFIGSPAFCANGIGATNGYWFTTGIAIGNLGFANASGSVEFFAGAAGQTFQDNTGFYPTGARDNTENLGQKNNRWQETFTTSIATSLSNTIAPFTISPFPATGVNWTNTNAWDVEIYIDNSGITGTAVKKNGTTIFTSLVGDCTIGLQPNETFSETYTVGTPTAKGSPR